MVQEAQRISQLTESTAPAEQVQIPVIVGDTVFGTYRMTLGTFLGGIYDVRVYGAVADVATTAQATLNAAAVQRAINAAGAAGGGVVFFPPGEWAMYPVGVIYDNIHIRGAGRSATKVKMGASPSVDLDEMFRFGIAVGAGSPTPIVNCSIGGMEGDGNKANQVNGSDPAGSNAAIVGVATVVGMVVYDMLIHDCDGYGISFFGTDFAGRSQWTVRDVEVHSCNYDGIDIKGGTTNKPIRMLFDNVYSHDNGPGNIVGRDSVGFDLRGEEITCINCRADSNTQNGFRFRDGSDGCYSANLISCWARDNTTAGFQVDGVATGVYRVEGGGAVANSAYGCRVEGGTLTLSGVQLSDQARGLTNFSTAAIIFANDCIIQDNDDYGIRADVTTTTLTVRGGIIRRNGLEGIRTACPVVDLADVQIIDNDQAGTNHAGVLFAATVAWWRAVGCRITNVAGATQNWAFDFASGVGAGVLDSYIAGNATAAFTGTLPAGTRYTGTNGTGFGLPKGADVTIVSGAITVTGNVTAVSNEGAAASDDLDTVSGTFDSQIIVLVAKDDAQTVVCKDGTGNLALNGDFSLTSTADRLVLISNGTTLFELARSDNAV